MNQLSKRQSETGLHCEQIQARGASLQIHRHNIKRDTLAICRKPAVLGAAFGVGWLLASHLSRAAPPSESATNHESKTKSLLDFWVGTAARAALTTVLSTVFGFISTALIPPGRKARQQ